MRRLIINADDFGLTGGINRAILQSHLEGVVTSATLMAGANAFEDAVSLTAFAPRCSIGCHITLLDGASLLQASEIPTLIEGGNFYASVGMFAPRAIRGRINPAEIEIEAVAQIRRLQDAKISVSHVDTHKHTHILPQILRPLLQAAQACGVRRIRNPFEPLRPASLAGHPGLWKRWIVFRTLHALARVFRQTVNDAGMITTDGTIGMVATGALDNEQFRGLIENLPEGTWEFVCHPGYLDAELRSQQTRLQKSREQELNILTSPSTRELLQRNHIELISYHDVT